MSRISRMNRAWQIWLGNLFIKICYPAKDSYWPSRRWNRARNNYQDMSGY